MLLRNWFISPWFSSGDCILVPFLILVVKEKLVSLSTLTCLCCLHTNNRNYWFFEKVYIKCDFLKN